jgi:hypothetical protein
MRSSLRTRVCLLTATVMLANCEQEQSRSERNVSAKVEHSQERSMPKERSGYPMHFLRGNDPAKAPGAVVIYPVADDNFIFDKERKAVVSRATGEWLTLQIGDREYNDFHSVLMNTPGGPITIAGFVGQTTRSGFGKTRAYNVTAIVNYAQDGPHHVDYSIETIAKFLNAYPDYFGQYEYTNHVVVIDNRKIRRAA